MSAYAHLRRLHPRLRPLPAWRAAAVCAALSLVLSAAAAPSARADALAACRLDAAGAAPRPGAAAGPDCVPARPVFDRWAPAPSMVALPGGKVLGAFVATQADPRSVGISTIISADGGDVTHRTIEDDTGQAADLGVRHHQLAQ